jgi:glycosyltransferase involved in cell wall biosynthesis
MELCRGDFILKLDADDEVMDPWCIPNALLEMLNVNARYLVSPYEVMDKGRLERFELLDRITWNDPDARYRHPMHECLENPPHTNKNTLISAHDLRVRDHRDSKGEGVRINSRNFKVLLHEFETASTPSIHCLMYLAREALQVDAHFAKEVLEGLMERDLERPMMAEAIYILGKAQEVEGEYLNALHSYSTAFRTDVQFQLKARLSAVRLNHRLQPSRNTISEMESLLYDIDTCIPFGVSQTEIAEVRGMLDRC